MNMSVRLTNFFSDITMRVKNTIMSFITYEKCIKQKNNLSYHSIDFFFLIE